MRAGSHGSSGRTTPSRDRDRHSDLDLDLDAASARARDGDGGGEGEKSAPPDLEVGGMSAASGGREYDPHTPSRSKLWSWFTPTKRAEDGDDDESEEWDEGCFVDAQAYLSDEHDEHDEHDDHYGTFISRLPDELYVNIRLHLLCHAASHALVLTRTRLIQIFLHLPPTHTQLHTLSAVSHLWHELSFSPLLWSRAFHSSPGFALTPEASARGVATTMPPPGKWDGLVWDRQAEGSSTSTRESKVLEKNSAGSHGERGWFGTRRHLQPNILGRSPTIPTSPDPSTSPRHASESAPTFPNSNTIIPQTRPGHTQPIHYPTLYRSRVALPHHIRNPTGSHSAHISTLTHHTDSVYCLQSSGRWMITGSRDRTVRLWRLAEIDEHGAIGETELLCVVSDAHGGSVLSLDFEVEAGDEDGGDGKGRGKMITGSSDTTAGVWRINWGDDGRGTLSRGSDSVSGTGGSTQKQANVDQPSVERIGTLRGHTGGVLDVLMGARHYVTCSKDATIRIYDRDDYSFLRSIAAHEGPVNCLARNPDREVEQVVSASGDGTWVVWGLETGEAVRNGGGDGRGLACVVWEVSGAICSLGTRGADDWDNPGRLHRYGR